MLCKALEVVPRAYPTKGSSDHVRVKVNLGRLVRKITNRWHYRPLPLCRRVVLYECTYQQMRNFGNNMQGMAFSVVQHGDKARGAGGVQVGAD